MRTQLLFGSLLVSLASLLPGCSEDSDNGNPSDGMPTSTDPAASTVAPPATTTAPSNTVAPPVNPTVAPTGTGGATGEQATEVEFHRVSPAEIRFGTPQLFIYRTSSMNELWARGSSRSSIFSAL